MPQQAFDQKIINRIIKRLKLKQLRLLVAIAEHSSILHAAEEIFISQPAATKLLKDLEHDFDVQLFHRTNRGVIPTEYGKILVKHGKLILAQLSHAGQELDDLKDGLGGRVVIGTLLTASARLLPEAIRHLHQDRPNVSIIVRDGTNDILMPMLTSGDLDFVVGRLPEYRYRDSFTQEFLYHEDVVIVARTGHPLSGKNSVTIQQLAECDWILPPSQTTLRRQITAEFQNQGLPVPLNPVESVSFLANRSLILNTDIIGVFPADVVEKEIKSGEFSVLDSKLTTPVSKVGVSYRNIESLSPAAIAFLSHLKKVAEINGQKH